MVDIRLEEINQTHIRVHCDSGIAQELSEFFSFRVPGYQYMPKFKSGFWDGYVRLFNVRTQTIYHGLRHHIETFADEREYEIEYLSDFSDDNFSLKEGVDFYKQLNVPNIEVRDYQIEAFVHGVRKKRALMTCPTGSGKSLIAYLLTRHYEAKTLIIVPTINLVGQMYGDFEDYGYDVDQFVHKLHGGQDKTVNKQVIITTWQTARTMSAKWLGQFEVVIGDEAHLFKAKELTGIMDKLVNCVYRFGLTGTLDGTQTNKLVLEGIFGPLKVITTTAKLIEEGHLSPLKIKCILFRYPDEIRKVLCSTDYQTEKDYILANETRTNFIVNLALSLKGNTILFFTEIDKHGKIIHQKVTEKAAGRRVFYVDGQVKGDDRNEIRAIVEKETNAIICASTGTTSTGFNVKNIHNIIFASPSKSKIRTLQSIGRGLRLKTDGVERCTLFDFADDLSWKTKKTLKSNHTLRHFSERIKIYDSEEFDYTIYKVGLK